MFVAASTSCFDYLGMEDAVEKIADLEFANIEISLDESGNHLKPSEVAQDVHAAVVRCSATRRLNLIAYYMQSDIEGEEYYEHFEAVCQLAKLTKVVTISVPSAELGTPFNEEVERMKRLVQIAELNGVRVGMRSQVGRISEDPDTVSVICDHVKGLGLALDPSHYVYGHNQPRNYEKLLKYVHNVYLRDTTKDQLQVQVGQGNIDYGKLVSQLGSMGYRRSLCVDIAQSDDSDQMAEMRKLRLLLESLLI